MTMKKIFTGCIITAAVLVLNGSVCLAQKKKPAAKASAAGDILQGKGLIAKSDCLTCHKLDVKLVGPAYKDVAKKYAATPENYNLLVSKIMNGGAGVWGQVPMVPHSTIPAADVKKMVKYILSLKS
jgi:cytochrome c